MLERFRQLFRYDDWANREVLASLRRAGSAPRRSLQLLSHIVAAEYLWFSRIHSQKPPLAVWPELTFDDCERHLVQMARTWSGYLSGIGEEALAQSTSYVNSKGEQWTNSVDDILMHVIMHSSYHRGQIASITRDAGHVPAYTDFIHAVRQEFIE